MNPGVERTHDVSERRKRLEQAFDDPGIRARLHRGAHRAVVEFTAAALRLAGPRVARELPALQVVEVVHTLPALPASCDGVRLLHLTDLHLESLPAPEAALEAVAGLTWDAMICTGDFAEGPAAPGLVESFFRPLLSSSTKPCVAVLGNHDRSHLLATLARAGFDVLMNEARALDFGGTTLWMAGVDDPATFGTGDLDRALSGVQPGACVVVLAHAPDLAEEAAARQCALYLSGHTHGGQIVLPGVGPLAYRTRYPRERIAGLWQCGGMPGYTSVGLGAHHGLVRVGCIPEVTIHVLRTGTAPRTRHDGPPPAGRR